MDDYTNYSDEDDYMEDSDLSDFAAAVLDMITSIEFQIPFSALTINEKIAVTCKAEDNLHEGLYDNIKDEDGNSVDQDVITYNIENCYRSIVDTIDDFSNKERLWIIMDKDKRRPMFLPAGFDDEISESATAEYEYGFLAFTNYDGAEEAIRHLKEKGVEASFDTYTAPRHLFKFLLEKYGYKWVYVAARIDLGVYISIEDIEEDNDELTGKITQYTQREGSGMPAVREEKLLLSIANELKYSDIYCVLKKTDDISKSDEKQYVLGFKSFINEKGEEEIFIPVYTLREEAQSVEVPFDCEIVRLPFVFVLMLSEEAQIKAVINPETDYFVVPKNIRDLFEESKFHSQLNDFLSGINEENKKSE